MGLELAEQFDWRLPDVILYPDRRRHRPDRHVESLRRAGPTRLARRRAAAADGARCNPTGCAPIVRAFDAGQRFAEPFAGAATIASGIRVPAAVGDFMILDAVRASGGRALAVAGGPHPRVDGPRRTGLEGISICPETAACIGALERLASEGWITPHERIVVFNTGAAQKYPEAMAVDLPWCIDKDRPIDWDRFTREV